MHLYLSFILALSLSVPLTAEMDCKCTFPNQISGMLAIDNEYKNIYLVPEESKFEVDYKLKRSRIFLSKNSSLIIHDMENNTMYKFPNRSDPTKGECKSIKLTDDYNLPPCVPKNFVVNYNSSFDIIYIRSFFETTSQYDVRYVNATICEPYSFILDQTKADNPGTAYIRAYQLSNKLLSKDPDFFPNTARCIRKSIYDF